MIENSPVLEKSIYDIVANFSIVHNGKFSERCLTFFKNLLAGTSSKAGEIEEVITRSIVEYVLKSSDDEIPSNIIKGLESFSSDTNFNNIVKLLLSKIIKVVEILKVNKYSGKLNPDDSKKRDVFLSCISFLSTASKEEENLLVMACSKSLVISIEKQVIDLLSEVDDILCNDEKTLELLQKLLNLIKSMSTYFPDPEHSKEIALQTNLFIEGNLYNKIEDNLKVKLTEYIKMMGNNSLDDDPKNKSVDRSIILNKKLMFGNLIRCLGAISINDQKKINNIISPNSVPLKIFSILTLNNNDPIILSASCDFISYLFENEFIKQKSEIFTTIVNKISNLRTTIQYLNSNDPKYKNSCTIADKYSEGTMVRGIPVDFENLNNEILQRMLISIIKLITFFGKNALKSNSITALCISVCSDLNNFERETCLCECLLVPSDDVKKAAVECLYYVDCDQFSADEIEKIYKQVSNINLMVGDIELVVATIYIILAKCFQYFLDSGEKLNKEKIDTNKEAFIVAYDILQKNSERNPNDGGEASQKNILSLSLITFLNICTAYESNKKHLLDRKNTSKISKILFFEEKYFHQYEYFPIEIEKTRGGLSIMNLSDTIKSENALSPYSYVFLRLLIHIADLLMNIPDYPYILDKIDEFDIVIEKVSFQIRDREVKRIEFENMTFRQFVDKKKNKKINKEDKHITISQNEAKEEQAKFVGIFQNLLLFILGKTSHLKIAQYEKIWDDKFDKKFNSINIEINELKDKSNKNDSSNKECNVFENFKRYLREEEMKSMNSQKESLNEYDNIRTDLIKYLHYASSDDNHKTINENKNISRYGPEETANNPYLRGLIIAVFIRCIYALLEFPTEKEIKNSIILTILKGNNIKDISMLVDSTKLKDFNISSKYLIVMRIILVNAKSVKNAESIKTGNQEFNEKEYINQLGVIAYLIRKMIRVFKNDLKIEIDDHKILLSELSKCSAQILNELQSINFSDVSTREKVIQDMINFDCIKIFIKTVKEYMNKDSENYKLGSDKDKDNKEIKVIKDDEILNAMIFTISNILGEYMSKCKQSSYYIIEIFTRSYIFERVKIRKTYLREIIETSRNSDLKSRVEISLKIKILFLCRAFVLNWKTKTTTVKILIMTEQSLEFMEVKDIYDAKSDWEIDEFILDQELSIKNDEIESIYNLEYLNRIIIESKKEKISLLFTKINVSSQFNEFISEFQHIRISPRLKIFKFVEESAGDEPAEDNKPPSEVEDKSFMFLAIVNTNSLFNIFGVFKEKEILPGATIIVIHGKEITLYKENTANYLKIEFEYLIKNSMAILKDSFTYFTKYSLEDLHKIRFSKTDEIVLSFTDGSETSICVLDDPSYIKLKKSVFPYARKNNLRITYDEPYENIK